MQRLESKHKQNVQLYALQRRELDLREIRLKAENEKAAELADQRWAEATHTVATTAGVVEEIKVRVAKRRRRKLALVCMGIALSFGLYFLLKESDDRPDEYSAANFQFTVPGEPENDRRRHFVPLTDDDINKEALCDACIEYTIISTGRNSSAHDVFSDDVASCTVSIGSDQEEVGDASTEARGGLKAGERKFVHHDTGYTVSLTMQETAKIDVEDAHVIVGALSEAMKTSPLKIELPDGQSLTALPKVGIRMLILPRIPQEATVKVPLGPHSCRVPSELYPEVGSACRTAGSQGTNAMYYALTNTLVTDWAPALRLSAGLACPLAAAAVTDYWDRVVKAQGIIVYPGNPGSNFVKGMLLIQLRNDRDFTSVSARLLGIDPFETAQSFINSGFTSKGAAGRFAKGALEELQALAEEAFSLSDKVQVVEDIIEQLADKIRPRRPYITLPLVWIRAGSGDAGGEACADLYPAIEASLRPDSSSGLTPTAHLDLKDRPKCSSLPVVGVGYGSECADLVTDSSCVQTCTADFRGTGSGLYTCPTPTITVLASDCYSFNEEFDDPRPGPETCLAKSTCAGAACDDGDPATINDKCVGNTTTCAGTKSTAVTAVPGLLTGGGLICSRKPPCSTRPAAGLGYGNDCGELVVEGTCVQKCAVGYSGAGDGMYTCHGGTLARFNASSPPLVCLPNTCSGGATHEVIGGDYTVCNLRSTGGICVPACEAGYTASGSAFTMSCNDNGTYDGTAGRGWSCTANFCANGASAHIEGANYTTCSALRSGETCTPSCVSGYITSGSPFSISCDANNQFPGDGGGWDCVPARCSGGAINAVAGADTSVCDSLTTGEPCTPACLDGYTVSGTPFTLNCDVVSYTYNGSVGYWDCIPAPCSSVPEASEGYGLECAALTTDGTCNQTCLDGFVPTGSGVYTCPGGVLAGGKLRCSASDTVVDDGPDALFLEMLSEMASAVMPSRSESRWQEGVSDILAVDSDAADRRRSAFETAMVAGIEAGSSGKTRYRKADGPNPNPKQDMCVGKENNEACHKGDFDIRGVMGSYRPPDVDGLVISRVLGGSTHCRKLPTIVELYAIKDVNLSEWSIAWGDGSKEYKFPRPCPDDKRGCAYPEEQSQCEDDSQCTFGDGFRRGFCVDTISDP